MNPLLNFIPYVFLIAAQACGLVFIVRMYIEIRRLTKVERNLPLPRQCEN
jgi:hypothetical protein